MWISGDRKPSLPNRKLLLAVYAIPIESWDAEPAPSSNRPPASTSAEESWGEGTIAVRIEMLQRTVDELLASVSSPDGATTPLERAKVMTELGKSLDRLRRMRGEDVSEIKVLRHPKWLRIKEVVFEELRAHPEILRRILARLSETEPT